MSSGKLKFFVGLNTGYVTHGHPDERYIEFYRRRSSPALHCAIIGNVVIPGGFGSNTKTPTLSHTPVWTTVASAIKEQGTLPGIQLATTWEGYIGSKSFRPSTAHETIDRSRQVVRQLGSKKITSILGSLDDATNIALDAGFRHLQIHAAHGYLFNLLIDHRLNENAAEVRSQLARWAMRLTAVHVETSIRISLRSGDEHFDANGRDLFYEQIAGLPFDFIDVSSGFYNINKQLIYPGRPDLLRARRAETIALACRFPSRRFILSGRALLASQQDLPSNLHIGLCRDLIANPNYLADTKKGCVNSGKCHYFSRGTDQLTCAQWTDEP
ncbi:hypothetical protein OWM54_23790 [Myxococcus sp. MISCRS1]|uniref:oxidoreductase n=1 Tax=Myxococcus sp. MISCRS1 TaxID=2996786 RepID=UPI002270A016|nr:hypothetical protein [Myxococcus sp. MISCRS1]MCY1000165.1 hypothetical protein [Myxococcus sp. MISCRS1]